MASSTIESYRAGVSSMYLGLIQSIRRIWPWGILLLLASCASVVPRDYLVGKEELTRVIIRQFPLQKDQGLFHLALSAPQVSLRPEQNRVGFACDYEVKIMLGSGFLRGRFDASSDLRYDVPQRAVVLIKPQIEHLDVQGQGELPEPIKGLVNLAVAEVMRDYPLHRFAPGEPSFAGVELDITGITVEQQGVRLTLAPKQNRSTTLNTAPQTDRTMITTHSNSRSVPSSFPE